MTIDWRRYLGSDRAICDGQICARGTRVLSYPSLKPEHTDAAIAYAAELAGEESLLPLRTG